MRVRVVFLPVPTYGHGQEEDPVKDQTYWKPGDDYLGDPPVEEQGLNSVFDSDSTVSLIERYNKMLNEILK